MSICLKVLLLWMYLFLDATPDKEWEMKTKQTDTAILFGFGFEQDTFGNMTPGEANQALYELAVKYAGTDTLHLICRKA